MQNRCSTSEVRHLLPLIVTASVMVLGACSPGGTPAPSSGDTEPPDAESASLSAPEMEPGSERFEESFDDPSLAGWETSPGVSVVDGALSIPSDGFAFQPGRWSEFSLSVRARRSGGGLLGIRYVSTDAGGYLLSLGEEGASLSRESEGSSGELASASAAIPAGGWVEVTIRVVDGEHAIALDGETVLTASDAVPLRAGGLVLRAQGDAPGQFDDISIGPAEGIPAMPATTTGQPDVQTGTWRRLGGPIGGLGYDIRYNFADHNVWYVTDAWSGFYISTDNGGTWELSNTGISARKQIDGIPIFSATVDPHNPNTIWIGTDITADIYKSTDGGHTWVEMTNGVDPDLRPMSFRGFTVDPRTSDIVYAMAEIASPAWTPDHSPRKGTEGLDMTQGIVYRTTDGGRSWKEIWRGDNLARYCWIDPRDPDVLYISTGIFDRDAANSSVEDGLAGGVGVLKSLDGGETWRVLNHDNGLTDLYIGSLYMKPQEPDVLLAAAGHNTWSRSGAEFTGGIFLTEDGGETWERVIADNEIFSTVEFCDSDPEVAYAGSSRAIYRSDDGGHSWQRFTRSNNTWGSPGVVAGFPIDMQCDPADPERIFINNYLGGNFVSTDGGQTWTLSSDGYTGEQVNTVIAAPGAVVVGSRSGVFRYDDDGDSGWIGLVNPPEELGAKFNEIIALAIDPGDPNHLLAVPMDLNGVVYSTDGGQRWKVGSVFGPRRLVFAPSDPSIVYAAAETGLHVSHDGGVNWEAVAHEQVTGFTPSIVAVQPDDADTLYVGRPDAGVLKTQDGGQSWSLLTAGLPEAPVLALAIDAGDVTTLFATTGAGQPSVGGAGVFRSTDGGSTWAQVTAGLPPEGRFLNVVIDPTNSQTVYVADVLSGVYVYSDGGTTWASLNIGLQHREVNALSISADGRYLYAGTWGDGVYQLVTH
ncbi:MAG: YCF48-related protein [Candidatus Eisenbacteria bacterium]|nr:YCF48-related protein [Candidatus Eisenbacteria bacterium]